ncbi:MAG: aldehyde dehydrogenase family protein [Planctomycetota bacterium]|nr:aldehyde dehydrogenase family protein [Planctomycetota bacterium]
MPSDLSTLLQELEPWLEVMNSSAEESLFNEGDPGDSCFFIESGVVRVEQESAEIDTEPVLGYFGPGDIVGELALLDHGLRSASVVVEEDLVARKLSESALSEIGSSNPQLQAQVYQYLGAIAAGRLRYERNTETVYDPDGEVHEMVSSAKAAQKIFSSWSSDKVQALLSRIAAVAAERSEEQAKLAVEVTHLGNVKDKTQKNLVASLGVLKSLEGQATGLISRNTDTGVSIFGDPVGVVFALVPQTNPVSTAVFKTLIALKSRNALILSYHRSALRVAEEVGSMITEVLEEFGAPSGLVSWIKNRNSRRKTQSYFRHQGVSLILATGGRSMVRAAYGSGRPAIGVGSGNTPVLVCDDVRLKRCAEQIVLSKSFDNGLICGAEHNLIVFDSIYDDFVQVLEESGAAVLSEKESNQLLKTLYSPTGQIRRHLVGQAASDIAREAGIERKSQISLIVVPVNQIKKENPLCREKMAPVLSLFRCINQEEGMDFCERILEIDGAGHSAAIHSASKETMDEFARRMPVGRILANTPAAHGVVGITTGLVPSLTLGCGTFGGTSTTDNVTYTHLMNIKRLAEGRES